MFVEIAREVKWSGTNIRALDRALQQRPKVFEAVRVNLAVNVGNRVVDDRVRIFVFKTNVAE